MSAETTPAIERAERSLRDDGAYSDDVAREYLAQHALTAALSDPADPDWLARTLFVLHHSREMTPELALLHWEHRAETHRVEWRVAADGFRAAILGVTP
jgi:hypothetical protein